MLYVLSTRFWLISSSLKFFQKLGTTLYKRKKRWIELSFSVWQKLQRSLSFIPTFLRKSLVANRLCSNLNWKTIIFVDLVHWKRNWYAVLQSIGL